MFNTPWQYQNSTAGSANSFRCLLIPAEHSMDDKRCVSECLSTFYTVTDHFLGPFAYVHLHLSHSLQWGAADAEIKVPSGENTELKRSPFIAWSRSVYSHTCYAYCQGFLPCLFLPFQSIHLHFFQNLSQFFPVLALANTGSCVGPQNKIGQPA